MSKLSRQFGAVIAIAAVLVIFIMPAFDIQPTALRASRDARQLLLAFACVAIFATRSNFVPVVVALVTKANSAFTSQMPIVDLTCSRLC